MFFKIEASQATTYSKTEVDKSLPVKSNQSTTYSKTEVDNNLFLKEAKIKNNSNK